MVSWCVGVRGAAVGRFRRFTKSPMVSPAAPRQTVHAVLPHTAYRHRSPAGIHRRVAHRAFKSIDPEVAQPVPAVALGPVEPRPVVFPAGQNGHPFVNVGVDRTELRRGIPLAEVGAPAPQDRVELLTTTFSGSPTY